MNVKKLKILIVTEVFFPDSEGGAHTYIYNFAKFLVKRGNAVSVITLRAKPNLVSQENIDGIDIYRYNSPLSGPILFVRRPFFSALGACKIFKRLSKKFHYDIVNIHSILPGFGVLLCNQAKKSPRIFTFHASFYQEVMIQKKKKRYAPEFFISSIFWVIRYLERKVLKLCDKIIVLSNFNREQLQGLYSIPNDKIKVVPGGVDIDRFKPAPSKGIAKKQLGLKEDRTVLLTVRRLVPRMGIEKLLIAMKDVVKQRNNIQLIIGGRGYLKEDIEKMIRQESLSDNVRLVGYIDDKELVLYYQAADLFVLPTEYLEGFGLVTLEALAAGLPVIGTPLGGTQEILRDLDPRWLFRGTDPKEMAEDILKQLDFLQSAKDINRECRDYVISKYLWENIVAKIEEIFLNELGAKGRYNN